MFEKREQIERQLLCQRIVSLYMWEYDVNQIDLSRKMDYRQSNLSYWQSGVRRLTLYQLQCFLQVLPSEYGELLIDAAVRPLDEVSRKSLEERVDAIYRRMCLRNKKIREKGWR